MILHDDAGQPVYISNSAALARTVDTSISASTEITLNASTRVVKVYAITKDVYFKWGTDDVTASNFDEVVIAGQQITLKVPNGETALNVIQREATASVIILEQ